MLKTWVSAVGSAIAHHLAKRAESGALGRWMKSKASVRCAAGSLSFFGQKESDGGFKPEVQHTYQ
jgi:hypothetical protein